MKTPDLELSEAGLLMLPCLTRVEFAALLNVSLRTADRIIAAKEIRVRRIRGRAVRILRSDVERYLNAD